MNSKRFQRKDGVHVKQLNKQAFLAHPGTDTIFHLNVLGCAIWHVLETPMHMDEIAALLYTAFPGVPEEEIYSDLTSLISLLNKNDLITIISDKPEDTTS